MGVREISAFNVKTYLSLDVDVSFSKCYGWL